MTLCNLLAGSLNLYKRTGQRQFLFCCCHEVVFFTTVQQKRKEKEFPRKALFLFSAQWSLTAHSLVFLQGTCRHLSFHFSFKTSVPSVKTFNSDLTIIVCLPNRSPPPPPFFFRSRRPLSSIWTFCPSKVAIEDVVEKQRATCCRHRRGDSSQSKFGFSLPLGRQDLNSSSLSLSFHSLYLSIAASVSASASFNSFPTRKLRWNHS